jgi:hypothetical protein
MNISPTASAAAAQIALQTIAQQNAQDPNQLAAAIAEPQNTALALTNAQAALSTEQSTPTPPAVPQGTTATVGTNVNTYA